MANGSPTNQTPSSDVINAFQTELRSIRQYLDQQFKTIATTVLSPLGDTGDKAGRRAREGISAAILRNPELKYIINFGQESEKKFKSLSYEQRMFRTVLIDEFKKQGKEFQTQQLSQSLFWAKSLDTKFPDKFQYEITRLLDQEYIQQIPGVRTELKNIAHIIGATGVALSKAGIESLFLGMPRVMGNFLLKHFESKEHRLERELRNEEILLKFTEEKVKFLDTHNETMARLHGMYENRINVIQSTYNKRIADLDANTKKLNNDRLRWVETYNEHIVRARTGDAIYQDRVKEAVKQVEHINAQLKANTQQIQTIKDGQHYATARAKELHDKRIEKENKQYAKQEIHLQLLEQRLKLQMTNMSFFNPQVYGLIFGLFKSTLAVQLKSMSDKFKWHFDYVENLWGYGAIGKVLAVSLIPVIESWRLGKVMLKNTFNLVKGTFGLAEKIINKMGFKGFIDFLFSPAGITVGVFLYTWFKNYVWEPYLKEPMAKIGEILAVGVFLYTWFKNYVIADMSRSRNEQLSFHGRLDILDKHIEQIRNPVLRWFTEQSYNEFKWICAAIEVIYRAVQIVPATVADITTILTTLGYNLYQRIIAAIKAPWKYFRKDKSDDSTFSEMYQKEIQNKLVDWDYSYSYVKNTTDDLTAAWKRTTTGVSLDFDKIKKSQKDTDEYYKKAKKTSDFRVDLENKIIEELTNRGILVGNLDRLSKQASIETHAAIDNYFKNKKPDEIIGKDITTEATTILKELLPTLNDISNNQNTLSSIGGVLDSLYEKDAIRNKQNESLLEKIDRIEHNLDRILAQYQPRNISDVFNNVGADFSTYIDTPTLSPAH